MDTSSTCKADVKVVDKKHVKQSVLFLIPTLTGGGAERVVVNLMNHLDRTKFRLSLAVIDIRKAAFMNDLPDDVEFIDLGCKRVLYALPKIITLIWKLRPDVVFSTLGHLNLALAMARSFLPNGVRYIVRETTLVSYGIQAYRYPEIWAALYRWFYSNHDLVVCQSRAMQSDLVDRFGLPEYKSVVINNPIDLVRIRMKAMEQVTYSSVGADSIKLVAAGRFSAEKGFDMLIEAVALLNDACINLTLLGEGPLENGLKQLAKEKGVHGQIHFTGFQANPYAWFAKADVFILSSRYEGFPNVVLEALACGTSVIATPAPGGTREILDGIDGCVIAKALTAGALADAISKWIENRHEHITPAALAPYALEKIISSYEQVLFH